MRKDEKADLSLRSVYNYGNYGFTAVFNTSDKVNVTATIDKVGTGSFLGLCSVLGWDSARPGQRVQLRLLGMSSSTACNVAREARRGW